MRSAASELTRLADVASERVTDDAVAVVRGFDRTSRERAKALRHELAGRGVPTVEVTPTTAAMLRRGGTPLTGPDDQHIGLIVDSGAGGGLARRLAAELGVPVLRPKAKATPARYSALGVFDAGGPVGVALDDVVAVPLDARECQIAVAQGAEPPCLTTGTVRLSLEHPQVGRADQITVTTTRRQTCAGPIRLAADRGPWVLHSDGTPLRPLDGPVEVRCLIDRIQQFTA